jgi:hypothetical protein
MASKPPHPGFPGQVVSHGGQYWVWDANLGDWVGNLSREFHEDRDRRPPLDEEDVDDIRDLDH